MHLYSYNIIIVYYFNYNDILYTYYYIVLHIYINYNVLVIRYCIIY
jgi:hypothetical protein